MSEYRELDIDGNNIIRQVGDGSIRTFPCVRYIEKSAYDAIHSEVNKLRETRKELRAAMNFVTMQNMSMYLNASGLIKAIFQVVNRALAKDDERFNEVRE